MAGAWQRAVRDLSYRGHLREAYDVYVRSGEDPGNGPVALPSAFAELALLGTIPADTARAAFAAWLRRPSLDLPELALPWWAAVGDTASLHAYARRADSAARAGHEPLILGRHRYRAEAARAYGALARRDSAEALRRLMRLPDSLCYRCWFAPLTRVELLTRRGRDAEAATLLRRTLWSKKAHTRLLSEVFWALQRGRVAERLGDRETARRSYRFVADVWAHADPALQPYVAEANRALARLQSELASTVRVPSGGR
jgi:hypothetical protein